MDLKNYIKPFNPEFEPLEYRPGNLYRFNLNTGVTSGQCGSPACPPSPACY
jgi:hypothetical protein